MNFSFDQNQYLKKWNLLNNISCDVISNIDKLYTNSNVIVYIDGKVIINSSKIELLNIYSEALINLYVVDIDLMLDLLKYSLEILQFLNETNIKSLSIDIKKLALLKNEKINKNKPIKEFIESNIYNFINKIKQSSNFEYNNIVLYGFGRIGRIIAKLLIEKSSVSYPLYLRAIVLRKSENYNLKKRVELLKKDSIHGRFNSVIECDEENNIIIANGFIIRIIHSDSPEEIDYKSYNINDATLIDSTGKWTDEIALNKHLKSKSISKVILTAPAKGSIKTIIMGVNHNIYNDSDLIISASSCTSNAVIPILKPLNDKFNIDFGHIETVHAYTNDQNLIDNIHRKDRRGKSAVLNMIPTDTGAANSIDNIIPDLKGRITASAVRVPVSNVSMAMLHIKLNEMIANQDLNDLLKKISMKPYPENQIYYSSSLESVSSDFIGLEFASIIDAPKTKVQDNGRILIYIWYDNEWGYSSQILKLIEYIHKVYK